MSCTIEENECVKVPKNVDNVRSLEQTYLIKKRYLLINVVFPSPSQSAENVGYSTVVKNFDPKSLLGSWYKTDGLNPNYDLFDCQTNTFSISEGAESDASELDMGIFFRVSRPTSSGGGFWVRIFFSLK